MSKGTYDHVSHSRAADTRASRPREEVFTNRELKPMLDIRTKPWRESLMVPPYDHARPVKNNLDVTGSMGHIPRFLATDAKRGLPGMVKGIYPFMADPQLCFCGIDDSRTSSQAPLQVGHFEGEGHKMDQWLTELYLVGGGGGNGGESYELGFFVGARLVRADCFKHGIKGYDFTIADDGIFPEVRAMDVQRWMGIDIPGDIPTGDIVKELFQNWNAFMICPDPGRFGQVEENWRQYFGDHVICAPSHEDIAVIECGLIGLTEGTLTDLDVFDKLMLEEFGRTDSRERSRVIATLEKYAATLGRAGEERPVQERGAKSRRRSSGTARV